jgi:hypothetical protein
VFPNTKQFCVNLVEVTVELLGRGGCIQSGIRDFEFAANSVTSLGSQQLLNQSTLLGFLPWITAMPSGSDRISLFSALYPWVTTFCCRFPGDTSESLYRHHDNSLDVVA